MRRGIDYLTNNYGECLWKSSQGLEASSNKRKDVMEGIAGGARQSRVTYFANHQWLGKHGHWKQNQGNIVWWTHRITYNQNGWVIRRG